MPAPYVSPYQRAQRARAFIEAMSPVEFDMYVTGMSREAVEAAHRARAGTLSAMSASRRSMNSSPACRITSSIWCAPLAAKRTDCRTQHQGLYAPDVWP